ncbi:hypothetical protein [Clostridium sp. OS1-26]|uniref:hypothetical protein n=1 Tax=Clostridium sp. OS1-26 TaxID=3070681 RepID=UPI0027E084E3|nr:hypothetical protein [Clostridium sp. OS1-26]WML34977.1 hypothetical protein RCG18_27685 [Clostridium sp. OS1-26]
MQPILLKNCTLINFENYSILKKDILLKNGKIEQIADNINFESDKLRVIDVKEHYALPGFIDCHTL